jgi:serine phosphatase RsbU (regulator of sigma subunit)
MRTKTMPDTALDRRRLPGAALAAGALVFALGLALALARLPEWRLRALPDQAGLGRELQGLAARCGLALAGRGPRFELVETSRRRHLASELPVVSSVPSAAAAVRADQEAVAAGPGRAPVAATLQVWFDSRGRPQAVSWKPVRLREALAALRSPPRPPEGLAARFSSALLLPGERLDPPAKRRLFGVPFDIYPIAGSAPPQHVTAAAVLLPASIEIDASRNPGSAAALLARWSALDPLAGSFAMMLRQLVLLVVAITFLVLAIRRRIGVANAVWIGALCGLAVAPGALLQPSAEDAATALLQLLFTSAWLALLWSTAESLWRAAGPRFDPALDLLRARRLSARTGAALLAGSGLGAAAAGLGLAAYALATFLPGARAHALSVDLPVLHGTHGPLAAGVILAAVIAFMVACGRRLSSRRWVPVAAAVAAAAVLSPVQLQPWPLGLAGGALVAGVLVAAGELRGLAGLLAACLASRLLPAAVFSGMHLAWLPGSFALAAGGMAVLLATGIAGIRRRSGGREQEDDDAARPPAFVLRLERERRLEVEMELLARVQRGLLPSVPELPGWEIAARSLLADRAGGDLYDFLRDGAGRWWIAAGDVAGHGYSCAIAQAMVKAALASLIGSAGPGSDGPGGIGPDGINPRGPAGAEGSTSHEVAGGRHGRTPAEVLSETDRVLRTAGAGRSFTSLALIRLDPATGQALFANAGHPFPLLAEPGGSGGRPPAREVALPGLPLGQGPPRRYLDLPLALAPGAVLVLCSDGLFEARGAAGGARGGGGAAAEYGWERPRALLEELAGRTAAEVLEGLLADWRRHQGEGAPADDTTIVVVRRR